MHVRLLTELSELDHIWAEWMALYRARGQSPFQNPELHRIWWTHLGEREGWSPLIAVGRQHDQLVAVASLAVRRSGPLRILEWAGVAAFDYPDVLLAQDTDPSPLWETICRRGRFDIARLRWVRGDSPGGQTLARFAHRMGDGNAVRAIELTHATGQAWLASMPKSMRAEHREKLRLMERRGPVVLRQVTRPEAIGPAVDTLIRLKAEWSRARGTETVFLSDGLAAYFEAVALAALRDRTLHLTALYCGDQTLAVHLGFASRDGFYYYVSSYDLAAAKLSPGRVHMNLLIMWAIDQGMHRFDFLRGDADYKSRLGTTSRHLDDYVFSRGLVGEAALRAYLWRQNRQAARPSQPIASIPVGAAAEPALSMAMSGGVDV